MIQKDMLEGLFRGRGFSDFKWMSARDIRVAQWVRFRCMFGCSEYGKSGTCPPNVPSVEECRQMISEYNHAAIFHFEKGFDDPGDRKAWSREIAEGLLQVEREVFLSGYYKTILVPFDSCGFCADCPGKREDCRHPDMARPGADALGIDVYATARSVGYPIEVLKDYSDVMNRYAFLLVE